MNKELKAVEEHDFIVKPDGIIQGGTASYTVDTVSGLITYKASVQVKVFFFTQTKNYDGKYPVDPKLLLPSTLNTVGEKQQLGNVEFQVVSTDGKTSLVDINVLGQNMTGTAVVDLTGDVIAIDSLNAQAAVMGMQLYLQLVPA